MELGARGIVPQLGELGRLPVGRGAALVRRSAAAVALHRAHVGGLRGVRRGPTPARRIVAIAACCHGTCRGAGRT
jgi:hypothetical protein